MSGVLHVGLPAMKLKNGGSGTKTSMPIRKACREAGCERASKSKTLDPSRSGKNFALRMVEKPDGTFSFSATAVPSGDEMASFFETKAAEYSERRVKNGGKALRKDAPIAATFIMKPAAEDAADWDVKTRSGWIMQSLMAWQKVWGHTPDYAIVHLDEEGPHIHVFDRMLDVNGDYRMSKVMTRGKLHEWHEKYVETLREHGFNVKAHDRTNDDGSPRYSNENGLSQEDLARKKAWEEKQAKEREEFEKQKAHLEESQKAVNARSTELMREAMAQSKTRKQIDEDFLAWRQEKSNMDVRRSSLRHEEKAAEEKTSELAAREEDVAAREEAVKNAEDVREQQMADAKREVEDYKSTQMMMARTNAREYEQQRKAEVDEQVKVEAGRKVEAIDAELDEYRARKRAAIEDEADKQVKRLSEPIDEQVQNVVGNNPFDFVADVLDEAVRRLDEEGLKFTTGEPFSGLLKDAAEWCRTLSAVALDENEMGDKVLDVRRGLRKWVGTHFKRAIKANIARPVSIDVPSPVSVTPPPPAEVYGVSDREDEYFL